MTEQRYRARRDADPEKPLQSRDKRVDTTPCRLVPSTAAASFRHLRESIAEFPVCSIAARTDDECLVDARCGLSANAGLASGSSASWLGGQ
jgi:hypothetical protein